MKHPLTYHFPTNKEESEPMRKNQSHSEESRARIAESLHAAREAGRWKSPGGPLWTAHEDSLLGTMPDKQVAAATGRSLGSIYARRSKLGIPSMRPPGRPVGWRKNKEQSEPAH